jgi:hypothetical protein
LALLRVDIPIASHETEHGGKTPNDQHDAHDQPRDGVTRNSKRDQHTPDQDPHRWMGLYAGHPQHHQYLLNSNVPDLQQSIGASGRHNWLLYYL